MQSSVPVAFTNNPSPRIQRSVFDRSFGHKTTFDAGLLIPYYWDEVLPGDTFNYDSTLFIRMATPVFPIMDNLWVETQCFFIPARLLSSTFKNMMGEQEDPADNITNYLNPLFDRATYPAAGFALNSLYDYMGLPILIAPPGGTMNLDIVSLLPRAYNFTWNHWYRDQNLQDPVFFTDDATVADDYADYVVLRRGKRKDYFTSALLEPQKLMGQALPLIPSNTQYAGFELVTRHPPSGAYTGQTLIRRSSTGAVWGTTNPDGVGSNGSGQLQDQGDATLLSLDPNGTMRVDIDPANFMGTINELRVSVQMQRFMEADNRGGTRYPELVWNHFGVVTPDLLWRPEYIGGHSGERVNISPVQQTSESGTTPQGNLAAFGTATVHTRWTKSFNEHGFILCLVSVRADMNYQQNLDKAWTRYSRFDYYWPTFAHLGEEAVLLNEIFASTASWANQSTGFGYQERYASYRYKNSLITGLFRSNAPASLDAWHVAQDFGTPPALDATFIEENPPVDRVIAVPTEPHFIMDSYTKLRCARPMPVHAVPGLMDHF